MTLFAFSPTCVYLLNVQMYIVYDYQSSMLCKPSVFIHILDECQSINSFLLKIYNFAIERCSREILAFNTDIVQT